LDFPQGLHPLWITWLTPEQIEAIAAAAGIPRSVVESMTLSVYDGDALKLDPKLAASMNIFLWRRWLSRFCPECLVESDGRWQLQWRLGWTFACFRHNSLLSDEWRMTMKQIRGLSPEEKAAYDQERFAWLAADVVLETHDTVALTRQTRIILARSRST
jgi:hypothetical protein